MEWLMFAISTAVVLVLSWVVLLWFGVRLMAAVIEELKRQDNLKGLDEDA